VYNYFIVMQSYDCHNTTQHINLWSNQFTTSEWMQIIKNATVLTKNIINIAGR